MHCILYVENVQYSINFSECQIMLLHYQFHQPEHLIQHPPIVFIHGLFGSLSNLAMLVRALQDQYPVLQIDVRNHGLSGHHELHDYEVLAQDVIETLDHLQIDQFSVIGHSMGGKIAMRLADLAADRMHKLVVLDISPSSAQTDHHTHIFNALMAVEHANVNTRQQATEIMQKFIDEMMVIQFLLKSFQHGRWLFNVNVLAQSYANILAWDQQAPWPKAALFLRGGESDYISRPEHFTSIEQQFPYAVIQTIDGAGHWLHGEKPQQVLAHIQAYLNQR